MAVPQFPTAKKLCCPISPAVAPGCDRLRAAPANHWLDASSSSGPSGPPPSHLFKPLSRQHLAGNSSQ
ncbi:hypothetical protein IF1G_06978 [Cordyceps javanica]|uniref:Uncharacterized protein n=1 Tax=Cordyceps javanica TaxID=43265 RepID=A0A545UX98_9HYPO|nr:hypothetical protein IF1G_06978 [Cordyceps javanica]